MIELFISACLISHPVDCRDVSLIFSSEDLTPHQCMMRSEIEIAKWAEGQPKWFAKHWGCRTAGRVAELRLHTAPRRYRPTSRLLL